MAPKTLPKSMKNRQKMDIKIDQNFACILNGLLVALGVNMAPKASQKEAGRGCQSPPVFGLGADLGAPRGSWRAAEAQQPILIGFCLIFDWVFSMFDGFWHEFLQNFWIDF